MTPKSIRDLMESEGFVQDLKYACYFKFLVTAASGIENMEHEIALQCGIFRGRCAKHGRSSNRRLNGKKRVVTQQHLFTVYVTGGPRQGPIPKLRMVTSSDFSRFCACYISKCPHFVDWIF